MIEVTARDRPHFRVRRGEIREREKNRESMKKKNLSMVDSQEEFGLYIYFYL